MTPVFSLVGATEWLAPLGAVLAQSQPIDASALAIRVVVALGVTAGALLIITHLLQRFGYGGTGSSTSRAKAGRGTGQRGGGKAKGAKPQVMVEQIMPLTRQAKVATIVVDGHRLLVGITDHNVTLLKDLNEAQDAGHSGVGDSHDGDDDVVRGELERYPIDLAVIRAAQLRQRRAD